MLKGFLIATISAAFFLLLSLLQVDVDRYLMGVFLDKRGVIPHPKKISLVVIADKDYEEPLKLSPKYKPTSEIYINLIQKVLSAAPELILLDSEELPELETRTHYEQHVGGQDARAPETLQEFLKNDKIRIFNEKVYTEDKVAYHFPKESELFTYLKDSKDQFSKREPFYINFYGPQNTLDKLSFSDALQGADSTLKDLKEKIVIVSRESAIFQKGHIEVKRFTVPLTSPPISSAEIQATILSNIIDGTYFTELNKSYRLALIILAFTVALALSLIPNFWGSMFSLIAFSYLTFLVVYKFIFQSYLWGRGVSVIVIVPLLALLIHMIISLINIAKTYYKTRKDFFMD